jgi:hypothetical protein
MTITAAEIVRRAQSGWPYNSVPYSQSQIWNDGAGPSIDGYRMDCSGFASMAANLSTSGGGLSTVTFLTTGTVRLISWADLSPGDFVGALGPGTAGDAGHIMVVESVDHPRNTYTVLEQAGYGAGPDRNTYTIGNGQGRNYLPYRLSNLAGGDDMGVFCKKGDTGDAVYRLQGRLQMLGYDLGSAGVDGDYGDMTAAGLKAALATLPWVGGVTDGSAYWAGEDAHLDVVIARFATKGQTGGGGIQPNSTVTIHGTISNG